MAEEKEREKSSENSEAEGRVEVLSDRVSAAKKKDEGEKSVRNLKEKPRKRHLAQRK